MRIRESMAILVLATAFGLFGTAAPAAEDCELFYGVAEYEIDGEPESLAVGDLNGDLVPDLVVANSEGESAAVLLGHGDGTFAAPAYYPISGVAVSVAIGDINGDQIPDLAVVNILNDVVSVLLGIGDGTFSDAVDYAAGYYPRSVAIGDLNGDLVPDLAVANQIPN